MRLDLRSDFSEIYKHVEERVRAFDHSNNDGPGNGTQVVRITLGYQFDQAGWVALVFDTRHGAEPDGEWQSHITGNMSERPHWLAAIEILETEPVILTLQDGSEYGLDPDANEVEFAGILGELLKSVFLAARSNAVFARLPKASRCELSVEEHDGHFGWPNYEDRGKENLV